MKNEIRALTGNELQSIAGGYWDPFHPFGWPDPVFVNPGSPWPVDPEVNPPGPDPSWLNPEILFNPVTPAAPAKPIGPGKP